MMPSTTDTQWLLNALKQPLQNNKSMHLSDFSTVNWTKLISYADYHGITPLLCHRLQANCELWAKIPATAQDRLEQGYLNSARRNLSMFQQFLKLIKMLQKDDIPVVVLKGAFLAHAVYQDHALRPMVDIDMLIRRRNVPSIESALKGLGYELKYRNHRKWYLEHHYHLSYVHPTNNVTIEVHWDIQRPHSSYPVQIDELWANTNTFSIAGVELLGLSVEHLLLHICLHNAKHGFGVGLRPLCDLAAILTRYKDQIAWQIVQEDAARWHLTKAVYLSLYLVQDLFDCVSDSILLMFNPGTVSTDVITIARDQSLTYGRARPRLSPAFLDLWEGKEHQIKAIRLLQRIFLPPDMMASVYNLPLDSKRIYLAYPFRIIDLLVRYPRIMRDLIRKDEATIGRARQSSDVNALRQWLAG